MTRFRPSRAGLINIWDYVDEEFVFADGRLVLRGHNGSGKTKALEVLFPFILDGVADARRLDPFSGENRTMKSNLLYRGQDSEYGFVWMEFADGDRVVTLIIGLRAHKDKPAATTSFFVTRKRIGVDFGLLTADGRRPLTERQLVGILGKDANFGSATEYRTAIDTELFGLGLQRYTQLIDLLLALRRPLLAKDLDPQKVSATLTAGLSPVSEELVDQAARDFENLAAVQKLVEDLTVSDGAAREFLAVYSDYLRVNGRYHLDRVLERKRQAAKHATELRRVSIEAERAAAAEGKAIEERDGAGHRKTELIGVLNGLKQHEAYKGQERLDGLREQVSDGQATLLKRKAAHSKVEGRLAGMKREAEQASRKIEGHRTACAQEAVAQEQAARAAGIDHDDVDLVTVKARAAARRDDVQEVRKRLTEVAVAQEEQQRKDETRASAETKLGEADEARARAETAVQQARDDVRQRFDSWASHWAPQADEPDPIVSSDAITALSTALEEVKGPGASALTAVYVDLTQDRRSRLVTEKAHATLDLEQRQKEQQEIVSERDRVAAETDDAPILPRTRCGGRHDRPGAALWQLVRFADEVDEAMAASLEAAMEAAGLLTGWIHPDPAMTVTALGNGANDAYLCPLPESERPTGRTLDEILIPEDQDLVPVQILTDVLTSIALLDTLDPSTSAPAISTNGRFTYGVQIGGWGKPKPEYIGATYRAARRAERIADCEQRIEALATTITGLEQQLKRISERFEDLQQAQKELPSIKGIQTALTEVSKASALLAAARKELTEAAGAYDTALANTDAARRRLRQTAGDRNLPAEPDALGLADQAVTDYQASAERRHTELGTVTALEETQQGQINLIEEMEADHLQEAEDLHESEQKQLQLARELATLENSLSAPLKKILEEITTAESDLKKASSAWTKADGDAQREHDALIEARTAREHNQQALADSIATLLDTSHAAAPFTDPELQPILGINTQDTWPHPAQWPLPDHAVEQLLDRLETEAPEQAVNGVIPESATELLQLLDAATHGRACGEIARKNAQQSLSDALKIFGDVLNGRDEDYRLEWHPADSLVEVRVYDADGRHSVGEFAARTGERAEEQRFLLEERERTVLEDELLSALSQQIFERVFVAKELVTGMDADTRSRPMSNGTTVGIRWGTAAKITDLQREVSTLLDHESLGPEQLGQLRQLLRHMMREYKAMHPRATYKEALANVLDYRTWRSFELRLQVPGEKEVTLSRKQHSLMSGGEKSAAIHLPLFAAANAIYGSAKPDCPRMIALDEAFAGIDDRYKPDLLGLTVQYQLDTFMTGHDLWVRYDTVPAAAHYDMHSDKLTHTVSAMLILWDGTELVDSGTGFTGNEELAAELLGFVPTRRAPGELGLLEFDAADNGEALP